MPTSTYPKTEYVLTAQSSTARPPTFSGNHSILSWTDSLSGSPVRRYRHYIRQHINASSDMIASKYVLKNVPGNFSASRWPRANPSSISHISYKGTPFGASPTVFLVGSVATGSAANDAAGKFYADVRNKMSTLKGMVSGAESREAKRMMVSRANRILGSISPHQRRLQKRWRGKGSKRAKAKALSDSWLELSFGWLPLFSDIEDAVKALNEPRTQYARVFGASRHSEVQANNSLSWGVGIGKGAGQYQEITSYDVKYYGEIRARETPQGSKLMDFGLHRREFLPTLWEVIPWSWLVDYFTNVGSIVNALSYASADICWASRVVKTSRKRTASMSFAIVDADNTVQQTYVNIPSSWEAERVQTVRTGTVEVPVPGLTWRMPDSPHRWINLAALAVSKRLRLFY